MPYSTARRANLCFALATSFILALGLNVLPSAQAQPSSNAATPSGPPQQITASFSDKDNFIERLRRQGVSDGEAHSIDKAIRSALTPAQRKTGALIQLTFGGDGWPWTLQSIAIEPITGTSLTLDRASVLPAVAPAKVQPASVKAVTPNNPPSSLQIGKASTANAIDPFSDNASITALAPAHGAIDPEYPVQPPKASAAVKPGQPLTVVHGVLSNDVNRSLLAAGLPARIAGEIAQAVALHSPLRNTSLAGNRFDVAYEPLRDASVGFVLVEFTVNGGRERIWRYRPEGGVPGFYTDDGVRIGGVAMQSPVPGAAIVSPYGMRKHPVLRVAKMHWGVDYEANTGTPILAAADGIIEDARRSGNYGLYVRIGHSEGVETTYGHMSRFEPSMRAGTTVKAGDVIGYAGRSGLASGPHLYFEVFVDGKRVDPEPVVSDQPLRLGAADLALFEALKQQATAVQTAAQRP